MAWVTCVRCHHSTNSNSMKNIPTCPQCKAKMHTAAHTNRPRNISKLQATGKADQVKVIDPNSYCCTHCGGKMHQQRRKTTLCIFCVSARVDITMLCGRPTSKGTPCKLFGQEHYEGYCFHHQNKSSSPSKSNG